MSADHAMVWVASNLQYLLAAFVLGAGLVVLLLVWIVNAAARALH